MSRIVTMTDPLTGRVGMYEELGESGNPADPNASRNAPLNNPAAYLDRIRMHSDLDLLEVLMSGSVTINYPAVPQGVLVNDNDYVSVLGYFTYEGDPKDDPIVSFPDLGYVPWALVVVGDNTVWPGMPVGAYLAGAARYATVYTRSNELRVKVTTTRGQSGDLPAASITYNYLIFKQPPPPEGRTLLDFDPETGVTEAGLGKFRSERRYLQAAPGGSPFRLTKGRTLDLGNGVARAFLSEVTHVDAYPSFSSAWACVGSWYAYLYRTGPIVTYDGSYGGPTSIMVQAP